MAKKVVTWLSVAFVLFVVSNPAGAASLVRWLGSGLTDIAIGFGDFFTRLAT